VRQWAAGPSRTLHWIHLRLVVHQFCCSIHAELYLIFPCFPLSPSSPKRIHLWSDHTAFVSPFDIKLLVAETDPVRVLSYSLSRKRNIKPFAVVWYAYTRASR
jgi:hypothetical protein